MKKLAVLLLLAVGLSACGQKATPVAAKPAATSSTTPASSGAVAGATSAASPAAPAQDPVIAAVDTAFKTRHPDTAGLAHQITALTPAGQGLAVFEVATPQGLLYTNATTTWVGVGHVYLPPAAGEELVDQAQRPAAQMALASLQSGTAPTAVVAPQVPGQPAAPADLTGRDLFNSLPLNAAWHKVYGAGRRKVVVFEDPDCPFCQRFHGELDAAGAALNVDVAVFPLVLDYLHPGAMARARAIACTPDPGLAWSRWMAAANTLPENGREQKALDALWARWSPTNAPTATCPIASMVDTWKAAAAQMGFGATPTLLFENGASVEGAISRKDFAEMLDQAERDVARTPAIQADTAPASAKAALDALQDAAVPAKPGLAHERRSGSP